MIRLFRLSPPMRLGLVVFLSTVFLAGCSGALQGKKIDYKSATKMPPLEVPPDLAAPASDPRYQVPESKSDRATFSDYSAGRAAPAQPGAPVMPAGDRVRLERGGIQRWLVVKAPPDQVWPIVRDFWQEGGFILTEADPRIGYMETDWVENRAKIPLGGLTGLLNRALEFATSMPERDKYRTRLERGADPGTTEVYLSHKGIAEVYFRERDTNTRWQVRPSDPELEAIMLSRLAIRLGLPEQQVETAAKAVEAQPARASLQRDDAGSVVALADGFDRAWRRVGLALDRVGFMVEDRNRAEGLFFVRYQDPEAEPPKPQGVSRLAFWRSSEKKGPEQYRIKVAANGASGTQVRVIDAAGTSDQSDTARRILGLLVEQLK